MHQIRGVRGFVHLRVYPKYPETDEVIYRSCS